MKSPITCPPVQPARLPDDLISERKQRFLSEIRIQIPNTCSSAPPPIRTLSPTAEKILSEAARTKGIFLTAIRERNELHPATFRKAIEELVDIEFVKVHSLPRRTRGGKPKVLEILRAATPELEKLNLSFPLRKLKGGFLHDLYAYFIGIFEWREEHILEFEKTFGRKTFDFVLFRKTNPPRGYEICLSGTGERNADQIEKALDQSEVEEIVAVFEGKRLLNSTRQAVNRKNLSHRALGRVEFRLTGEYIERVLEGEHNARE